MLEKIEPASSERVQNWIGCDWLQLVAILPRLPVELRANNEN